MRAVNELEGMFELPAKNPRKKANVISILLFRYSYTRNYIHLFLFFQDLAPLKK